MNYSSIDIPIDSNYIFEHIENKNGGSMILTTLLLACGEEKTDTAEPSEEPIVEVAT